ncbi:MAG: 3-phosphoshikimate 1-carboxyvinyltransferase, partial [Ferruginibacter sp.]
CHGKSMISGVSRLAAKESDRAASLIDIFSRMGASIEVEGDDMIITGGIILKGASLHSHHDHRIAMAAAVAALRAEGETTIEDAEAINKSYPDFYEHLQAIGAVLNVDG